MSKRIVVKYLLFLFLDTRSHFDILGSKIKGSSQEVTEMHDIMFLRGERVGRIIRMLDEMLNGILSTVTFLDRIPSRSMFAFHPFRVD